MASPPDKDDELQKKGHSTRGLHLDALWERHASRRNIAVQLALVCSLPLFSTDGYCFVLPLERFTLMFYVVLFV